MDFDDFARDTYTDVLRTVTLALGDRDVAADATQEAYARAVLRWHRVAAMDRPAGWVCVVATNVGRRALRRRRNDHGSLRATMGDHADQIIESLTFRDQLRGLPERQRAALVLRYLGDLSIAETAKALGVTQGTVKASTHAALQTLRTTIDVED